MSGRDPQARALIFGFTTGAALVLLTGVLPLLGKLSELRGALDVQISPAVLKLQLDGRTVYRFEDLGTGAVCFTDNHDFIACVPAPESCR